ncbi:MAG TPA: YraN family protein [Candidatus Paceibacterota bacterium]|nr:YraN family protein [Candidatus Paceibacterota bacterium]
MDSLEVGKLGEELACGYLVNKGYRIIDRNFRKGFGEIDVITKRQDGVLVFIEVKTMTKHNDPVEKSPASYPHLAGYESNLERIIPEDQMTLSKINKFKKICQWYANNNPKLVLENGYQLDVLSIIIQNNRVFIKHYQNII